MDQKKVIDFTFSASTIYVPTTHNTHPQTGEVTPWKSNKRKWVWTITKEIFDISFLRVKLFSRDLKKLYNSLLAW